MISWVRINPQVGKKKKIYFFIIHYWMTANDSRGNIFLFLFGYKRWTLIAWILKKYIHGRDVADFKA